MCFLSPAAPVSFHHPIFPFFTCSTSAAYRCASFYPFTSRHLLLLFLPLASPSRSPLLRRWGERKIWTAAQNSLLRLWCVCVGGHRWATRHQHTSEAQVCVCVCVKEKGILNQTSMETGTSEHLNIYSSSEVGILMSEPWLSKLRREGEGRADGGQADGAVFTPVCVLQLEESAGALPSVYPWELHDFQHVLTRMWRCYGGCIPCSSAGLFFSPRNPN